MRDTWRQDVSARRVPGPETRAACVHKGQQARDSNSIWIKKGAASANATRSSSGAHRALLAIVFRAEHRLRPVAGYGISTSPGGPEQNRSASLNLFDIQQNAAIYRVQASLKERDKSCPPKPLTPALHPFRKAAERVRASTPSTLRRTRISNRAKRAGNLSSR
jgi:hypothetical protein